MYSGTPDNFSAWARTWEAKERESVHITGSVISRRCVLWVRSSTSTWSSGCAKMAIDCSPAAYFSVMATKAETVSFEGEKRYGLVKASPSPESSVEGTFIRREFCNPVARYRLL